MKAFVVSLSAVLLALAVASHPVKTRADTGDLIAGIAIAAGVTALAVAAAKAAQGDINADHYDYSHSLSPQGNAIAACAHRAWREERRQGARRLIIRKVLEARRTGAQTFRVRLRLQARYRRDKDRFNVACRVKRDRVVRFRYV